MNFAETSLTLFCLILDFGKGSNALRLSKELGGATGGTIFFRKRHSKNGMVKHVRGAFDLRKEILITIIDEN